VLLGRGAKREEATRVLYRDREREKSELDEGRKEALAAQEPSRSQALRQSRQGSFARGIRCTPWAQTSSRFPALVQLAEPRPSPVMQQNERAPFRRARRPMVISACLTLTARWGPSPSPPTASKISDTSSPPSPEDTPCYSTARELIAEAHTSPLSPPSRTGLKATLLNYHTRLLHRAGIPVTFLKALSGAPLPLALALPDSECWQLGPVALPTGASRFLYIYSIR
jgi:hypothetical protein